MEFDHPNPHSPIGLAIKNALIASLVCTAIYVVGFWAIDYANSLIGASPAKKAPTWIGTGILASQTGWPVVALSTLCGLLGRELKGLYSCLIATFFLTLIDASAALLVGGVIALISSKDD